MANYDERKQKYEALNDSQKQMWNDKVSGMDSWAEAKQFTDRYNQEQNQTNTQSSSQPYDISKAQDTRTQDYKQKQPENLDMTMDEYKKQNQANNQVSPDLDQSKFNEAPWKITVQEWSAKDTWKPDYQISTDARLNEMKGNLDQYFQDSPRMFSDRETFNRVFQYNERESDAQRQLLDSYWKRKEDMDKASTYTSWEAINNWMKNWEITTDQLNLLKEYNPEAYQKWQQLQEDEIMKRIVNDIVPKTVEEISWKINSMIEALGIQAQDALDIEWIYNDTMAKTWAYQTLEDCNRTVKQIEEVINKKTAIMNRYASSTWWTVSDALAAARMAKAIAPYNEQLQGLQYQYQDYANLYSQKTATATQAANVRAMQAQENQRIWQQKCSALWFATSALSYRTPEEQAQLDIQKQQALNESNLLYQSKLQDLNRYNTYATAKLQNQLQNELTDLSVEDENQLKANLNNALSDYYKNYWDIIQRSQAQAVEDILAYAKKNGVSVAQALTDNFIKPLQNKAEYKQKVASDYGMLSKQSISTINWRSVIMTTNPDGSISYKYIDDPYDTWIASMYTVWDTTYVKLTNGDTMTVDEYNKKYKNKSVKPYDMVDSKVFDTSPVSHSYYTLADFMLENEPKNWEVKKWWQCAKFVNDYLEKIWVGRYFGNEDIKTREQWINSDSAKVWTIAIFDYNHTSSDWINHGHVWIVVDTDENWFRVLDSNYDTKNPETIAKRYIRYGSSSCKGFFDPSQPPAVSTDSKTQLTAVEEAMKQNYLEEARRWKLWVNDIKDIWDLAAKQGWSDEWQEAFKWWQNWDYSDTQLKRMDKFYEDFKNNTDVKNFDSAKDQFRQLVVALNDESWVWDMSAIFTFMKTLDPTSVVREWEFQAAANTIWDANWDAILLKLENHINWEKLSKKQRQQFKEVAKEFIRIQADSYQQQYDFLERRYKWAWISEDDLPPNTAKLLLDSLWGEATWPADKAQKYFDWLQSNTTTNTWVGSVTSDYMYSKIDFILNG